MEPLILCNDKGVATGFATWEEAHLGHGKLHQAFSVYIFSADGTEFLLQKRSVKKPLWPRFFANTCCSHPRKNLPVEEAAPLRLSEECGFTCPLQEVATFTYESKDPHGKGTEHEFVTVLTGTIGKERALHPNPDEVEILEWIPVYDLLVRMRNRPTEFAPWFHLGLPSALDAVR